MQQMFPSDTSQSAAPGWEQAIRTIYKHVSIRLTFSQLSHSRRKVTQLTLILRVFYMKVTHLPMTWSDDGEKGVVYPPPSCFQLCLLQQPALQCPYTLLHQPSLF